MNLRTRILGALAVCLLASCSGCPGPKWEGTEALTSELKCGMTPEETKELLKHYKSVKWIENDCAPCHFAFNRGNTSVALDFDESTLVGYEVFWESRFMYTEVLGPVNLCSTGEGE